MVKSNTITVKLVSSPNGEQRKVKQTLLGLGLRRIGNVRELVDTDAVRGMINKVSHLVKVEQ